MNRSSVMNKRLPSKEQERGSKRGRWDSEYADEKVKSVWGYSRDNVSGSLLRFAICWEDGIIANPGMSPCAIVWG